jgi:hypothetical protein
LKITQPSEPWIKKIKAPASYLKKKLPSLLRTVHCQQATSQLLPPPRAPMRLVDRYMRG